eukprot:6202450-Pleurochrysis_carterae.AAC.2
MGVLHRPTVACRAGHSFCAACLTGLTVCPCCRGEVSQHTLTPNLLVQSFIDAALVRCGAGSEGKSPIAYLLHITAACRAARTLQAALLVPSDLRRMDLYCLQDTRSPI